MKTCNICILLAVISVSIVRSKNVLAATTIDTTSHASPWASVGRWGEVGSETIGQTFTVGSDNRLDNFTFYVTSTINDEFTDHLVFGAYVMKWDGSKAIGPILFESGHIRTTGNLLKWGFEQIDVDTGGLHLDVGGRYVAFFSVTDYISGPLSSGWAAYVGEAYANGTFVYIDNGSSFSALTTTPWVTNYPGGDLAFTMSFNIPEPTTLLLLGLGSFVLTKRKR